MCACVAVRGEQARERDVAHRALVEAVMLTGVGPTKEQGGVEASNRPAGYSCDTSDMDVTKSAASNA